MSSPNRRVSGQINELLFNYNLHGDVDSPEAPSPLNSPGYDSNSASTRLSESSSVKASEYAQGRRSWASKDLNGDRSSVADMVTEYWSSRRDGMFESNEQITHPDHLQRSPSDRSAVNNCDQYSDITERPVDSHEDGANAQPSKNSSPISQENDRFSSTFHSFEEDPDGERQSRWQRPDRWKRTGIVAPPYSCCPRCDKLYYCPFCVTWTSSSANGQQSEGSKPPSVLMLSERNSIERTGDRRMTRGIADNGNNSYGGDNIEQSLVVDRSSACWSFALPEGSEKVGKKRDNNVGTPCEGETSHNRYRECTTPSRRLSDLLTVGATTPISSSPPTQPTKSRTSRIFNRRLKRKRRFLMADNRPTLVPDDRLDMCTPPPAIPMDSDSSTPSSPPAPAKLGTQEPLTASSIPSQQQSPPHPNTPASARDTPEARHKRAGSARYSLFRASSDEPGKSMAERILNNRQASISQTQPEITPEATSRVPAGAAGANNLTQKAGTTSDPVSTEPTEGEGKEKKKKTRRKNFLARFFNKMWPTTFSKKFPPEDPGTGLPRRPLPPPDWLEAVEVEEVAGPSQGTKAKGKQRRQSQQVPRSIEDGGLQKVFKGEAAPDLRRPSFEMDGVSCSNCGYTKFVRQDGGDPEL